MRCGLFGKLPSKRDFIAVDVPREFLEIWEPWIQGSLSASRQTLGKEWQQAFLTAPIWRFWLGAELCGRPVLGAFVSSVDGIGRYFPLTLVAIPADGTTIAPPDIDPQDGWFERVEEFLLSTLHPDATFDAVTAGLASLVRPSDDQPLPRSADLTEVAEGMVAQIAGRPLRDVFSSLRLAAHANVYAAATFWWTSGGEGYAPLAMGSRRMPSPFQFTEMLTGRFAFGFD